MNNNEFDLLEIIRKLWEKKVFLLFCLFAPAIIALIVSLLLPKRYTSSATVLAPEVAAGGGIIQTPFGGFSAGNLRQNIISSQAVIALLKSDKMLGDIVDHFNLVEKLGFKKKGMAMKFIKEEMTSIELLSNEGVIRISVEAYSPDMSKSIVEFYLSNLETLNTIFELTTQSPVVKVISPSYLPEKKSFPKTKMNMGIAGLLGLALGLLYIYFKERTYQRV